MPSTPDPTGRPGPPDPVAGTTPRDAPRYVFTGDSITHAGRDRDAQGLGDGWVREVARRLAGAGAAADVRNTGVPGDRTRDLLARWREDTLALEPDVLTVLVGVNDVWPGGPGTTPLTALEDQLGELVDVALESVPNGLVLVEPFCVPIGARQQRLGQEVAAVAALLGRLAAVADVPVVPAASVLADTARRLGPAALTGDGVHLTTRGHRLLAELWLETVRPLTRTA